MKGCGRGIRPVPRAARRAPRGDPDVRPALRLGDRGGRGDRLVRAAARRRARRGCPRDHARRPGRGVQALRDGPRVPAAQDPALARDRAGDPLPGGRHRRARRGVRGGGHRGRGGEGRARGRQRVARHRQPEGRRRDEPPAARARADHRGRAGASWTTRLASACAPRSPPASWSTSTAPTAGNTRPRTWAAPRRSTMPPGDGVAGRQRRVLGLVELRAEFSVSRSELDDADRGAEDVDLDALDQAARQHRGRRERGRLPRLEGGRHRRRDRGLAERDDRPRRGLRALSASHREGGRRPARAPASTARTGSRSAPRRTLASSRPASTAATR